MERSFLRPALSIAACLVVLTNFANARATANAGKTAAEVDGKVKLSVTPELVILSAEWCGPCLDLEKELTQFSGSLLTIQVNGRTTQIPFRTVDVSRPRQAAIASKKYGLFTSYPSSFFVQNGMVSNPIRGSDLKAILQYVNESIAERKLMGSPRVRGPLREGYGLVSFFSTGTDLREPPDINSKIIATAESILNRALALPRSQVFPMYGHTIKSRVPESYGELSLSLTSVDAPSNMLGLLHLIDTLQVSTARNHLMVLVGQGESKGNPMGDSDSLMIAGTIEDIIRKTTDKTHSSTVLVSGTCFGGQFASAENLACGFFASPPDLSAAPCSLVPAPMQAQDYITGFFKSLWVQTKASQTPVADKDGDGSVSFAEAHWYSVATGTAFDLPYTSLDFLVDMWIEPAMLFAGGSKISLSDLDALAARFASPAESAALKAMQPPKLRGTSLLTQIDLAKKTSEGLLNAALGINEAKLRILARRLLAKRFLASGNSGSMPAAKFETLKTRWNATVKCEEQPIRDFLMPKVN